jgi:cytochrome c oxidase subunit II
MPFQGEFDSLFRQDAVIAAAVFVLVVLALAGALALSWRRRRQGRPASPRASADRVEVGYVAVLSVLAVFLIATSFAANARDFPSVKPALRVAVTAYQWCWSFRYIPSGSGAGRTVTAGRAVAGQCHEGAPPVLVLPTGKPVELDVTSVDVVHAFWIPALRLKTTAYPGHTDSVTVTVPRAGRWPGRCANLCGIYHYDMNFTVEAVPPAAFSQFLSSPPGAAP